MTPYWLLFAATAFMALVRVRPGPSNPRQSAWAMEWVLFFALLTLLIGFRQEVGGDWFNYLDKLDQAAGQPLDEALSGIEVGYALLNWIGANEFGGVYTVNVICAALFTWGLLRFCRAQPKPWLALVVAIPYLVTVVAMGYSRQAVAIGLSMLGLVALGQGRMWRFALWIALAASFHRSAAILLPLAVFGQSRNRWINAAIAVIACVLLYVLVVQETMNEYVSSYVQAGIDSSGALVRVAMNAVPAALFLWRRKRFDLPPAQKKFWTSMCWTALGFLVLLAVSTSSTAVDRIALYWIPVQLFVWSRVPGSLGSTPQDSARLSQFVTLYSALVLFVWLVFAQNASAWIPYRFYLLEIT